MIKKTVTEETKVTKKKVVAKKAATKKKVTTKAAVNKPVAEKKAPAVKKAPIAKKATVAKKAPAVKKAPVVKKKTAATTDAKPVISDRERYEMVATMAYYRAEQRNFEPGNEQQDWYECEQIVDEMLKKNNPK